MLRRAFFFMLLALSLVSVAAVPVQAAQLREIGSTIFGRNGCVAGHSLSCPCSGCITSLNVPNGFAPRRTE